MSSDSRNVVGVAALNCAEPSNVETCDKFGIYEYPTLKLFRSGIEYNPSAGVISAGEIVEQGDETAAAMKQNLINLLQLQSPDTTGSNVPYIFIGFLLVTSLCILAVVKSTSVNQKYIIC